MAIRPEDFRVVLCFPPVWATDAPYLSIPALSAVLRQEGFNVLQRDFNAQFWNHFYLTEEIEFIYESMQREWDSLARKPNLCFQERQLQMAIAAVIGLDLDSFTREVQDRIIAPTHYRVLIKSLSRFARLSSAEKSGNGESVTGFLEYHDLLFADISLSHRALSAADLSSIASDKTRNPYDQFFRSSVLESVSQFEPDLVGISVVAINQVVPAFTLAQLLKSRLPNTHVVLGGPWCTHIHEQLRKHLLRFPYIDSVVIFEGENTLLQLCRAMIGLGDLSRIPNLLVPQADETPRSEVPVGLDLNELPTPDFAGLNLADYDSEFSLPLQASRGCYWGRCVFCSYHMLEPIYKTRSVSKLVGDVKSLLQDYDVKVLSFADALLSPAYARDFSTALLEENISIEWIAFAKIEKAFTFDSLGKMGRSGCVQISWGLESGNPRVQAVIDKVIDLHTAKRVLKDAAAAGIKNRVLLMYGLPTESFAEAQDTVEFIRNNLENVDSIAFNRFHPEAFTLLDGCASAFGLKPAGDDPKKDLTFLYSPVYKMSDEQLRLIKSEYEHLSRVLARRSQSASPNSLIRILAMVEQENPGCCDISLPNCGLRILSYVERIGGQQVRKYLTVAQNLSQ